MSRLYMSADGDGRPDRAWMAAFVRVLISRFREVWRLPIPRRREPRSELQDSRGVADALGAPLTYRLQGQNPLDVERVQLVGMRQGLEQLVQAPRQPPGIAHGIDELDALQLLFVAQHQLASFSQRTCRAAP